MTTTAEITTVNSETACRLAGVTYRQLDYWVREGLVEPSVPARGTGTHRRWTPEDVAALRLVKTLLAAQVDHRAILEAQRYLDLPADYLWVQGGIVGAGSGFDLLEALAFVPQTVVVNLATLRAFDLI